MGGPLSAVSHNYDHWALVQGLQKVAARSLLEAAPKERQPQTRNACGTTREIDSSLSGLAKRASRSRCCRSAWKMLSVLFSTLWLGLPCPSLVQVASRCPNPGRLVRSHAPDWFHLRASVRQVTTEMPLLWECMAGFVLGPLANKW